jgi:hypothetical protein
MTQLEAFDVRGVWDRVKPGLDEIKAKTLPAWRVEDMYAACVAKRAHIFMPDATGSDFVLLAQNHCEYSGKAYLMVVAAYSKAGDAVATFQSEIDRIARESGCHWIDFCSPRIGWERHARTHGYEPRLTVFRRELDGR